MELNNPNHENNLLTNETSIIVNANKEDTKTSNKLTGI